MTGFEYGGGVRNLKIAVANVSQTNEKLSKTRVYEISSIRNIIYDDTRAILRKAVSCLFIDISKL